MSPIYLYNEAILTSGNAIATSENCCCNDEPPSVGCQDQCQDLDIVVTGTVSDQGACDTAPVIAFLESIGYTNVVVSILEEPGGGGFVTYTYSYSGRCCGVQEGSTLLSGLCGFDDPGFLVANCVCDE
jgi:hypothetical protein